MPRSAAVSLVVLLLVAASFWLWRIAVIAPRSAAETPVLADGAAARPRDRSSLARVREPESSPPRRPILADEPASTPPVSPTITPLPLEEPANHGHQLGLDPLDPAATMPVHLTVFTPEGAPGSAAKVQWVWAPESAELSPSASVVSFEHRMWRNHAAVPYAAAQGETDAEGRVTLSVPRHLDGAIWLRIEHVDQVTYLRRLFGGRFEGESLRVVLEPGATLRGLVDGFLPSAEDFGPRTKIEGIWVVAFQVDGEQRVFAKRAALDLEGATPRSWSMAGLAPGIYEVKVMAWVSNSSSTQWKGLYTVPHHVLVHRGSAGELPIVLPPQVPIVRCAMR